MDKLSTELINGLYLLLPGFVVAAIVFSLTPLKGKKEVWEQVVSALMFTGIVKALVISLRWFFESVGRWKSIGIWTDNSTLVWSYVVAIIFGCLAAWTLNKGWAHGFARKLGLSKEIGTESVWRYAFDRHEWYVVLHLKGGKRIYGWPEIWPNESENGHFSLSQPAWLNDRGSEMSRMLQLERMLIPAADVTMVEMFKTQEQLDKLGVTEETCRQEQKSLSELHEKEVVNGE